MKKLKINLENCYGISKMNYEFDFSQKNIAIIYASNGTMKTSLAKTFDAIKDDDIYRIKDILDESKIRKCEIVDETDKRIEPDNIMVVNPFRDIEAKNQNLLMANPKLKEEYGEIYEKIETKKKDLCSKLTSLLFPNNKKKDICDELLSLWNYPNEYDLFKNISKDLDNSDMILELKIGELEKNYNILFDNKVYDFFKKESEITASIKDYAIRYNELMEKSPYMTSGIFNYNNCINVKDALIKNNFFKASNKVILKAKPNNINKDKIINSEEELKNFIEEERSRVLNTKELKEKFEIINKKLQKNDQLRKLSNVLENQQDIFCEYKDIDMFKKKVWIKAFSLYKKELNNLLEEYENNYEVIKLLCEKAKKEETDWKKALNIFKKKFVMPFTIEPSNQDDVILKTEIPSFKYLYNETEVTKEKLRDVLSTGEMRAYNILNFIFQLLVAQKEDKEKLIVLDDISDSFDYNNKYAVIETILEVLNYYNSNGDKLFNILLLTHNFDFYRNAVRVLDIDKDNTLIACKNINYIEVKKVGINIGDNIFNIFRDKLNSSGTTTNDKKIENLREVFISAIPIVRTLIENSSRSDKDKEYYDVLTSLLHYYPESFDKNKSTESIKLKDIKGIFEEKWVNKEIKVENEEKLVYEELMDLAKNINNPDKGEFLEVLQKKFILSMVIRLKAEKFMINKLGEEITKDINLNQTKNLLSLYKKKFSNDENLQILERVVMFCGEYIHINSFMYEPLIDMSAKDLYNLYNEVENLNI